MNFLHIEVLNNGTKTKKEKHRTRKIPHPLLKLQLVFFLQFKTKRVSLSLPLSYSLITSRVQELRSSDEREQEAGARRRQIERDCPLGPHRVPNHTSISEQVVWRRRRHHHLLVRLFARNCPKQVPPVERQPQFHILGRSKSVESREAFRTRCVPHACVAANNGILQVTKLRYSR